MTYSMPRNVPMKVDAECHEEVSDWAGVSAPCDKPAVGYRIDPEFGLPYPVCRKHHREPFWMTARAELAYAQRVQT